MRTLEEVLAYSRETGMDWALTAGEAGLLRREVEGLRALVDAALLHCFARGCGKLATHSDPDLHGDYACDEHARSPMGRVHYAKHVIALAAYSAVNEGGPDGGGSEAGRGG